MKPRRGTSNKGQDYEVVLSALFSLTLYEDPTIKDFILRSNVEDFGSFDDLLVTLQKVNGEEENYALQMKHKEKQNLLINPQCFETESKHEFGILSYCESFSKISERENYRFIIYTNAAPRPNRLGCVTKFNIETKGHCPGKEYFFLPSTSNSNNEANIYNFQVNDKTTITDTATEEVYKSFFKKFAFYTFQKNWHEIQELIIEQFKKMFHTNDKSVAMGFIDIFKLWKLHEFTKIEISKEELKIKILELILSPYIVFPSKCQSDQTFSLLDKAFTKFDVAVINGLDDKSFTKISSSPQFMENEDILHLAKNFKFLTKDIIKKNFTNTDLEFQVKHKIGYFHKECPLIIKIFEVNEATVLATILKFKTPQDKLHLVLSSGSPMNKETLSGFTVFETLHDLLETDKNLYHEIIKILKIFISERQYTYDELFRDDYEIAKQVTINDMFQMWEGNFRLQVGMESLPNPYIGRFVSTTLIKIESIDRMCNDLIVLSCKGNLKIIENLEKIVDTEFVPVEEYLKSEMNVSKLTLYQDKLTKEDFEHICERNSTRNVHLLELSNEKFFEWKTTKGSIETLRTCETVSKTFINECNMYEHFQNGINVIVARSGMGKSELLKKLKTTCPSKYVPIKIILKEHNSFFKKNNHTDEEILNYFLNHPNDDFLLVQAKRQLANRKQIFFFFDGIDELHSGNISTALDYIKRINSMGFRLWVCSRPNLLEPIEKHFNVFALEIKTFSKHDQKAYLKERLQGRGDIDSVIDEIFKNLEIILENREILDVPLQLYMITDILIEQSCQITSNMFVLSCMFRQFLVGRYRHFFNKSGCLHWDSLEKIVNDSKTYRTKQYQIAALNYFFSRDEFKSLHLQQDETFLRQIKTEGDFLGIVSRITDNVVIFSHDIYAVYFAALWLSENCQQMQDFLKQNLFSPECTRIRLIFDMILAEKHPAHVAVLYRNVTALKQNQMILDVVDNGGRSILHLACSHGCRYAIVKEIQDEIIDVDAIQNMQKIDEECGNILKYLLAEGQDPWKLDTLFQWNCLDYANKTISLLPFEIILKKYEGDSVIKRKVLDSDLFRNYKWTILYYSVIFSYTKLFVNAFSNASLKADKVKYLFHLAATWNSWKIVNILLDKQTDIDSTNKSRKTALHLAATMGHVEVVTLLLFKGANVDAVDQHGRTPLHLAVSNGHMQTIKELFKYNAKVDSCDLYGRTPLHLAVEKGNENLVKFLLEEKEAQINKQAWNGWGPIHLAVAEGHINIVNILLDKDADYDRMDQYGNKPLHIAAKYNNVDILKLLLTKSDNVDDLTKDGRTSLHLATEFGNGAGIELLLENDANINARDTSGRSVLHWAVIGRFPEIVDMLLKRNVDIDAVDNNGRNCLLWAAELGDLRIVSLLLNKMEKKINDKAINGSTALHWAATHGSSDIVNLLLDKGAEVNAEDKQGRTPLQWAALEGNCETVELLLSRNARRVSIGGKTALDFAHSVRK